MVVDERLVHSLCVAYRSQAVVIVTWRSMDSDVAVVLLGNWMLSFNQGMAG